ncbi:MAG: PD40 domain-containing protein [Acidobacteria bacterium]|nr:PD40 domain-containing protein [Acidobacteriota bacterium]
MPRRAACIVLFLAGCTLVAQERLPRFVSTPDVRGEQVLFTWEDDLWVGSLQGGSAHRLTTHPGTENNGRFSPDGKWIAFNARYDGQQEVYLMPSAGGTPRRLTWSGAATVLGWTPDGKKVLYRSFQDFDVRPVSRIYSVDLEGHEPEPLPLRKATEGAYSPDGARFAFSTRGDAEYYWKRYKGGQAPDLWIGDFQAGRFEKLSTFEGKNGHPMWAGGKVLFTSDRSPSGLTDLYALDPATKAVEPLTQVQQFDVQWPATDGRTVVFVHGGWLQALDLATRQIRRVELKVVSDAWKVAPRTVNPKDWIQSFALAKDALALEARGDVFLLPVDAAKPAPNLTRTPGTRERMPRLSPDGKKVAYWSDASGDYDLYVKPAEGGPAERIPTGLKTTVYHLEWSPDGSKILFGDKGFAIRVMDLATKKLSTLAEWHDLKNDEFTWEISDYAWSPDSRWVAYTVVEPSRNGRIWIQELATGKKVAVTSGFFDSLNPCFDLDGSSLYFLSYSNFETRIDPSEANHIQHAPVQIMRVQLKAGDETGPFRIDAEGLQERTAPLPVKPGNHFHLKAGKGVVAWAGIEGWDEDVLEEFWAPRGQDKWKLHFYDRATKKESVLNDTVSDWSFDPEGKKLALRKGGVFHVGEVASLTASKALPEKVDLERLSLRVEPRSEWAQIFEDCWRWYRDFFYDAGMHGQDWKAIHDKFAAWLPELNSRAELNWLLSQMVGELCVSHTYVSGGDFAPQLPLPTPVFTGRLGADLVPGNGHFRFARVFGPTPYKPDLKAPLADPAPKVKEGDYLLAIDGQPVAPPESLASRLQVVKGQKLKLTVNGKPSMEGARTVEVEPLQTDSTLRYERWVADNIAKVEKASGGQLGYLHLTAMGVANIGQFDKYWRAFRYRKGLVVDVRGNGGGWTEYFMIDKLEQKQVGFNVLRGMGPFRYPGSASDGRFVFLSNEQNGSDGEAFLAHARALKLGTIVGVPSWGGLVGIINTQRTVDGGRVEQSNNAFFGREGRWWVENHGADPDLLVENDPASLLAGQDRQLEVGVATLLKELKEKPTEAFPPVPAYPKR